MASLLGGIGVGAVAATRVVKTKAATKSAATGAEEKSFFDWLLGIVQKEDQFYETDPILKKVEDQKSSSIAGGTSSRKSNSITASVSVPQKELSGGGGFGSFVGGLFAKK